MRERMLNLTHLALLKAEAKRWPKPRSGWKAAWRRFRRWFRPAVLVVGVGLGLALPAEAIVVTCGPGFPCHPQTGACWTGWEACEFVGGTLPCVPHPECSSDPSSCWEAFYAQPPGFPSNWGIGPAPGAPTCELAQSALLAAMKDASPVQWEGLRNYVKAIERRIGRLGRKLAQGVYGTPLSRRYALASRHHAWLLTLSSLIWGLVSDPANPVYAALPGPGVFPPLGLPGPDATVTQAQIDGVAVWLTAMREVIITARQLTDTMDNLAGAILAADAGTPGAAQWVRRLARHADQVKAQLVQRGLAEIAARSSVIGPVVVESADCSTPTDAANVLPILVQQESALYHGHLLYAEFNAGPICDTAGTFPTWLVADAPGDTAVWTAFGTFSFADWLCTHGGYCATRDDVNGDGKADLLFRHTSGALTAWFMNGTQAGSSAALGGADSAWTVVGTGDFNGDGKTDLLWKHASGYMLIWLMDGATVLGTGSPGTASPAEWTFQGIGDFNGDGKDDVLWRHASGLMYIWLMNGTTLSGAGAPAGVGAEWVVEGVGDFNGDGKADILWRHTSGLILVWLMNGTVLSSSGSPSGVDSSWAIQGVGDTNGDGKADVIWQHTNGTILVWTMNGTTLAGSGSPGTNPQAMQAVGDFNGDGKADLLFRHLATGALTVWLLNGTALMTAGAPIPLSSAWQVTP